MKLRNCVLGLITILVIAPLSVNADSISITCNKTTIEPNSTFTCTINGNSSTSVTGVSAKVEVSNGLSLASASVDKSIWAGDGEGGAYELAAEAYPFPKGDFTIGTITVTAGSNEGNETITVKNIGFVDESFETNGVANASASIKIEAKNEEPDPTPTPNPGNSNPTTPENNNSSSSNSNNNSNVNANNTTTISSNNYLKKLEVVEAPITFNKKKNEYSIIVPNEITRLTIRAEVEDEKSTIGFNGNNDFVVGNNVVTILVTAENGSVKEYKINVERQAENISASSLSNITIDGYEIDFKSNVYEYDLTIEKTDSLKISTQTIDENAKVTITGNNELQTGSVIIIVVTAEDGTTTEYKIKVVISDEMDDKLEGEAPKTGIESYALIIGSSLVIISVAAYIAFKKKGKFIKI